MYKYIYIYHWPCLFRVSDRAQVASLVASYCTTIAQYTPPPTDTPCLCRAPYNIRNGNIV